MEEPERAYLLMNGKIDPATPRANKASAAMGNKVRLFETPLKSRAGNTLGTCLATREKTLPILPGRATFDGSR
ncbi:MAG: hypothetical protein DMG67_03850 [Acidobacteria bacterium]|nr:MAG: hypothetical protein DMG67_03850 [Acidobacteriota bacterium]